MKQQHCCSVCKRDDVKLCRWYGSFLRDDEIYCAAHRPQTEWLVPLCEDTDGSVWGYTSVPQDAIDRFNVLPEASA